MDMATDAVISNARNLKIIIGVSTAVVGALGTALGYLVAKNRLETKYAQLAEEEIAEAKAFYQHVNRTEFTSISEIADARGVEVDGDDFIETNSDVARAARAFVDYAAMASGPVVGEPKEAVRVEVEPGAVANVFVNGKPLVADEFDDIADVTLRTPDRPYIITEEEYQEGAEAFDQSALNYYTGDGVLADDHGDPVVDIDEAVGDENLLRFGHGTHDPDLVHIRNERFRIDFEVTRVNRRFGEDHTIRHSADRPRDLRFRSGRE